MNPYRLKHIETGLYYKPGSGGTLSDNGKIYTSGGNYLSYLQDSKDIVRIYPWTKIYKMHPEIFEKYKHVYESYKDANGNPILYYIAIPVTKDSFIKEELEIKTK